MANHHCKIETSPRLKRAHNLLKDNRWHTSREIASKARTIAPGSTVSELRTNGFNIETRYKGKVNGSRIFEYRITPEIKEQLLIPSIGDMAGFIREA